MNDIDTFSADKILANRPLVPVVVIDDPTHAEALAEALLAAGLDIIEITLRTPAAVEAIARIAQAFPEMLVGAGTVLNPEQAQQALDAGAQFGLAPGLNPSTVAHFQSAGIPFIPGIMTPTDIEAALSLGCRTLKFFPAEASGGVSMLKALSAPYASQGIRFCPTGGIGLNNMNDYLALPTVAAIGGSWLATQAQIAEQDWATITRQCKEALAAIAAR